MKEYCLDAQYHQESLMFTADFAQSSSDCRALDYGTLSICQEKFHHELERINQAEFPLCDRCLLHILRPTHTESALQALRTVVMS